MPRHPPSITTAALALIVAGCSAAAPDGGVPPDLAAPSSDLAAAVRSYRIERVDGCGMAGYQSTLAVAPGSTIAVATLARTDTKATCMTMNGPAEVRTYDICYAESAAGAPFRASKVATEKYLALTGVGLALSAGGEAAIAWTGNAPGVKGARLRCGASNLLLAIGRAGKFGAPRAVAISSAGAVPPDQAKQCIQDVCNQGDATGYWPTVAYAASGAPAIAFRDLHFGFAADDFASSDLEFAAGPGFAVTTVDVARGGGSFARLAFTPQGEPAILQYNGERELSTNGVWLHVRTGGVFRASRVSALRAGEQLGFAISRQGRVSIAFHDENAGKLVYLEAADGVTFGAPVDVDGDGITGQFPSLALDATGEPAIAYYRCRDYDPKDRSCDQSRDGLLLARREGGRWRVERVAGEAGLANLYEGTYPALGFDGGKAVIAFQSRAYDPGEMKSTTQLLVAREE